MPESLFATVSKKFLALQYAELKIRVLEERLRLKRIQMYGPGSEKLTNEQLELLELEPGVSAAEVVWSKISNALKRLGFRSRSFLEQPLSETSRACTIRVRTIKFREALE